jgi:tetratricopeptide (TPR) repeat protein
MCVTPGTTRFTETIRMLQDLSAEINKGRATAQTYLERGHAFRQMHALEAAIQDYEMVINAEEKPVSALLAEAYNYVNTSYRRLHQFDKAIASGEIAIKLDPANATWWSNLAFARYQVGQYDQALEELNHALKLDPNDWRGHYYRGTILTAFRRNDEALTDLSWVIENEPPNPAVYCWRAQTYLQIGDFHQAEHDCSHGIELEKNDPLLWAVRGWARYYMGDLYGALSDFEESAEIKDDPNVYLGCGLVYRALGVESGATIEFSKFAAAHPNGMVVALQELAAHLEKSTPVTV